MFTKYWRSYPWFLQLFLFAMMVFIFMSLGTLAIYSLIPKFTGVNPETFKQVKENADVNTVRALVYTNAIGSLMIFAVPCLLFAYLTTPRPAEYLGFRQPGRPIQWLLVIGIMIGFLFVTGYGEAWLSKHITLPAAMKQDQEQNENILLATLKLTSLHDQIIAFIGLSILPAFGEELMFRGIMMRFSKKRSRTMAIPILMSAVFFMLVHGTYLGYPFILVAGILLAFIYWYTGSIVASMVGHFIFNGIQVAIVFWGGKAFEIGGQVPVSLFIIGLVLTIGCFLLLKKTKTPLAATWAEDFYPSELKTIEQA